MIRTAKWNSNTWALLLDSLMTIPGMANDRAMWFERAHHRGIRVYDMCFAWNEV